MNEKIKKLICAIIGHSRICHSCWGYRSCGRCGETLGDNLASVDPGNETSVLIGHNCKTCRKNYKKCTWKDKLFVENPFSKRQTK